MDGANSRVSLDGQADEKLSLRVKEHAGRTVVTVAGEIDMASSPQLRDCLHDLSGIVVIDLADVTFLDSSGLSALVSACKRLRDLSGDLRLRAPQPGVRRIIEITGLGDFLI
jgi:anti-sigma B factor antagonist